jgi:ribosomal protein S12 methylthiotransferase accessory factor
MEALEFAVAEPQASAWEGIETTIGRLVSEFPPGLHLVDFAPRFGVHVVADQPVLAVECVDLTRDRSMLLPEALVFVPSPVAAPEVPFGATTNGLASGNTIEEATLHGLLEVMERDAVSMNRARDESQWIASDELPEPFRAMAARWRTIGIELAVRFVPNAFELPCFEAWVHERASTSVDLANGSGLHLDPAIALARAVCEAAQSRLSHIHGGRDDITRFFAKYADRAPPTRREAKEALLVQIFDRTRSVRFNDVPRVTSRRRSLAPVLDDVVERLLRKGFDTVFRHHFRRDLDGFAVVKIIVPRCEDVESDKRRMGPRLLSRVLAGA